MSSVEKISAEKMFEKVLELQEEVAAQRAKVRELTDKKDREASLERRLHAKTTEVEKLKKQIHKNSYNEHELNKVRDLVAVAFDLYKGDGWAGWKND